MFPCLPGARVPALIAALLIPAAAVASSVVDVQALDGVPDRVAYRAPEYPAALRESATNEDVQLTLVIALDGTVHEVEAVEASRPEFAQAARAVVKDMRFEPGYVDGLPVRYRIHVTMPFRTEGTAGGLDTELVGQDGAVLISEPTVEYSMAPVYPAELAADPRDGLARVNVLVDAVGTPSDPVVEYATHPAFAQAARDAVLAWKFSPAERKGGLVTARTDVIVRFRREDAAKSDAQRVLEEQLAHATDFDVAPEPVKQVALVYPYDALLANKRSTVSLNVLISPEGQVVRIVPDPGTGGDFAVAAAACMACWRFNPATKAGQPVFAQMKWQLVFTEDSSELQFDDVTRELLGQLRDGTFVSASPRSLDRPIAFKERVPPEWVPGQGNVEGDVLLEVIIDRNGRPQLPRVVSAPTPAIGYAAATAALRWRFEPPRVNGQSAHVRVKIPFHITADAGEKAADPGEKPAESGG